MVEVSIIIPVYNTEKYLSRAIESCLNQTFKDIEVILINDGSTDNSIFIAQKYAQKHKCIKIITTENKGLSEARNKGLETATGEYVIFLDSDDKIDSDMIEQCYNHAAEKGLEMVLFDTKVEVEDLKENDKEINYTYYKRDHIISPYSVLSGKQFIELYADKGGLLVSACLAFYSRKFLIDNNLRFLPNVYYEDVAFHYACMMAAKQIMYIPKAIHTRLYRDGSIMTSSLNIRKIYSIYEITKELYSSLFRYGKEHDNLFINYFFTLIRNLYRTVLGNVSRYDIEVATPYSDEILRLQKEAIDIYYRVLKLQDEKVSNIRKMLEFIEEVITPLGWISDEIINMAKAITSQREKVIYKIFNKLPLNAENKRVGVYGSGKHADFLLAKYKEVIGDIKAELVFIDSFKKSYSEKYHGYDIVNIDDIDNVGISEIVVLSYFYESEMCKSIFSRYGDKYIVHRIYNGDNDPIDSKKHLEIYNRLNNLYINGRKKIILIYTPLHTNIGDHMIAEASFKFFREYLPDYDVMEITSRQYVASRKEVKYRTNVDDIIVIPGGGFIGSLWPSGQYIYEIIKDFPDNKIVILPQTIYFDENDEGEKSKESAIELFNNHWNLSVCYREEISLKRSKLILGDKIKSYLMPDMALTLNFSDKQTAREGILLCLRKDKEGLLSDAQKEIIKEYFISSGEKVNETVMHWDNNIMPHQRKEVIDCKINQIKSHKLVITDTLHCMISCVISGTPCIALNNISSKVEGVYKTWLKDIKYLRFVDSYEDILSMDLENWDELHTQNYYTKSYDEYLKRLANVIIN